MNDPVQSRADTRDAAHRPSRTTNSPRCCRRSSPKTAEARESVERAVRTLAQQALEHTVGMTTDAYGSVKQIIAEIDRKLSEQINQILHHNEFQTLEGAWRGLHYLVTHTETDELLKIKALPASRNEVARMLKRYKGVAWDQARCSARSTKRNTGNSAVSRSAALSAISISTTARRTSRCSASCRRSRRPRTRRSSPARRRS